MRFGVNTWVWVSPLNVDELAKLAPHVKQMGFDWIELPIESVTDLDYAKAAEIVRDNGLGVSMCVVMSPDRDLIHPEQAVQNHCMDYMRHCVDACQTVGARTLAGPMYSSVGRLWQQTADERAHDVDVLVKNLGTVAKYAGDQGIVLGLEPLNRFETSFINLAEQAIEVIDRVNHPSCKILLDTFHMNIEEKSLGDAIRKTGSRLAHFHACENDRGAPGSGNVAWNEVAQALKDIGYDGTVVIESFTNKVKSIARAAAIWRPFEASQDALAQNGLTFLKKLLAA
jgi:D-psicose/D-tagatose/L-ribulose 3-epimerase